MMKRTIKAEQSIKDWRPWGFMGQTIPQDMPLVGMGKSKGGD